MKEAEAERQAAIQKQRELIEHEDTQKQLDRESNERIAEIRALGGLQSDENMDGLSDARENLNALNSTTQIQNTQNNFDKKLDFDKQKHRDTQSFNKQALLVKAANEQKKLAIALVNANKATDKKLSKKVAKNQGITK